MRLPFAEVAVQLHAADDVAVLKRTVKAGTVLNTETAALRAPTTIPAGHKIALRELPAGAVVRKYGHPIGVATQRIAPGEHVHTHNLALREMSRDYAFCADYQPVRMRPPELCRTFQGFARPGGRAGTRNYLAVISSVNCSASVSKYVAERFRGPELRRDFPNVDGVIAFTHKSGCSLLPSEPLRLLQRVMAGLARHPNIGGCVMIGLGCEVNQLQQLLQEQRLAAAQPGEAAPIWMNIQTVGGVRRTVEAGVQAVLKLLPGVNDVRRTPQPLSQLILALQCGGSDGNSGITANPALGVASDELVRQGGTAVLAETTEVYGAEHLLTRRAVSREVAERLLERIRWWEDHTRAYGASIDNNPSYGNKEGGLTTIYEKSLGAIAKAGQAPLAAVYHYAEPITARGLCFMDTPGNDPVSMTGLVSGGCTVGAFTTGRGSVYGCKPAPCLKIATNTPLYEHLQEDMDLNAGTILDGTETVAQVGQRIFEKILAVASGERTKSELAGLGDEEFAPWQIGPTL
jgi:altronate hydrolase